MDCADPLEGARVPRVKGIGRFSFVYTLPVLGSYSVHINFSRVWEKEGYEGERLTVETVFLQDEYS